MSSFYSQTIEFVKFHLRSNRECGALAFTNGLIDLLERREAMPKLQVPQLLLALLTKYTKSMRLDLTRLARLPTTLIVRTKELHFFG